MRLPTEAEWEAAAAYNANGERHTYPWGEEEPTTERAIYDEAQHDRPAPVGCCPAGIASCGALDLAGNVWEWAASHFAQYPAQSHVQISDFAQSKDFTDEEVVAPLRGGAHYMSGTYVRCAARDRDRPDGHVGNLGFRVLVSPRLAH